MKKLIRLVLFYIIGRPLYTVARLFYTPSGNKWKKLRFRGKFRTTTPEGKSFLLYNNAFYLETQIFWLGLDNLAWESKTRQIWSFFCAHSETIIDIGANTGIFSILAKVYNEKANVYAFEPQPNIYDILQKNNNINHFDIRCENFALADKPGELPFYNYGKNAFTTENTTAGSLNSEWRKEGQDSILVEVKKLSQYVEEMDVSTVDLIKIDVETFEYEVISGYGDYLAKHKPVIILEIQSEEIGRSVASLLTDVEYSFFYIDEDEGLQVVEKLGGHGKHHNYLLCPRAKRHLVIGFLY